MGWRIVKQPNGLYARFSDIVDDFTHGGLTEDEAVRVCCDQGLPDGIAVDYVKRAVDDDMSGLPREASTQKTDGLNRWRYSLDVITSIHGEKRRAEVLAELNCAEPEL
jgi:hypothetical protein